MGRALRDLPGEVVTDEALAVGTARRLATLEQSHSLQRNRALALLVLKAFFLRDDETVPDLTSAVVRQRGRRHATWIALLQRQDKGVSNAHLYRCIAVVLQEPLLGPIAAGLSFSHQRTLLPVLSGEAKRRLGRRAKAGSWSVSRLHDEVGRWLAAQGRATPMRARRTPFARLTAQLGRATDLAGSVEIAGIAPHDRATLGTQVEHLRVALDALTAELALAAGHAWESGADLRGGGETHLVAEPSSRSPRGE